MAGENNKRACFDVFIVKAIAPIFMKRILYIIVGLMMASVVLSLSSCKGPKLKDADEAYDIPRPDGYYKIVEREVTPWCVVKEESK